jgi:hypothetical protein
VSCPCWERRRADHSGTEVGTLAPGLDFSGVALRRRGVGCVGSLIGGDGGMLNAFFGVNAGRQRMTTAALLMIYCTSMSGSERNDSAKGLPNKTRIDRRCS